MTEAARIIPFNLDNGGGIRLVTVIPEEKPPGPHIAACGRLSLSKSRPHLTLEKLI